MSANPQRFAQIVLGAFEAAGLYTDPQVIAAGGPSTSTMTMLRKVADPDDSTTMGEPREPTWSKVDKAAGWVSGSARAVWKGDNPKPRDLASARGHLELSGSVGGPAQDANYVASPGERVEARESEDAVLRAINAMRADVEKLAGVPEAVADLSRRMAEVERRTESLDSPEGSP